MNTPDLLVSLPAGHKPTQTQALAGTWLIRQHYYVIIKQLTICSEDITDLLFAFSSLFFEVFLVQAL